MCLDGAETFRFTGYRSNGRELQGMGRFTNRFQTRHSDDIHNDLKTSNLMIKIALVLLNSLSLSLFALFYSKIR